MKQGFKQVIPPTQEAYKKLFPWSNVNLYLLRLIQDTVWEVTKSFCQFLLNQDLHLCLVFMVVIEQTH